MSDADTPRRVELPPAVPLWDGAHDTSVEYLGDRRRGRCTCGWHGQLRLGGAAGYHAQADADEHVNNSG